MLSSEVAALATFSWDWERKGIMRIIDLEPSSQSPHVSAGCVWSPVLLAVRQGSAVCASGLISPSGKRQGYSPSDTHQHCTPHTSLCSQGLPTPAQLNCPAQCLSAPDTRGKKAICGGWRWTGLGKACANGLLKRQSAMKMLFYTISFWI